MPTAIIVTFSETIASIAIHDKHVEDNDINSARLLDIALALNWDALAYNLAFKLHLTGGRLACSEPF